MSGTEYSNEPHANSRTVLKPCLVGFAVAGCGAQGGQETYHAVKQGLHALVLEGAAAEHWHKLVGDGPLVYELLQLLD